MKNKDFWESQAEKYSYDVKAVNFDPLGEELEFAFLEKLVQQNKVVCDFGCGNGRMLIHLAQKNRNCIFYGFDFVKGMIDVANEQKEKEGLSNVHFFIFDATSDNLLQQFDFKFDTVITKRLLINTKGDRKYKAIENIYSLLKDEGIYIMVECFLEPLNRINGIRNKLGLPEIKVKDFNEYLTSDFFEEICNYFQVDEKIDFGSFYYFISRIFNARLSGGEPDYFSKINMLAVELTNMGVAPFKGYSPEVIYILKKK